MIGVDPDMALGGDRPMFNFPFVQGTRREALEKLRHGRYCLVPDHFSAKAAGRGRQIAVIPPESPSTRRIRIAGVVSMDGWHWLSKNLRRGRAAGLMFAPYGEVRRDFGIQRVTHFWMNLDGTATEDEIKESLQTIAQRNFDGQLAKFAATRARARAANRPASAGADGNSRRTSICRRPKAFARRSSPRRRHRLGAVPTAAGDARRGLLGVHHTVLSSVPRAALGLGRLACHRHHPFRIVRIILAEATLVGTVAACLSLGLGSWPAIAARASRGTSTFAVAGHAPWSPLAKLTIGFGVTLVL